jgi:hypothetical protein
VKFKNNSVTLTLQVGPKFLDATHHLDAVDNYAMLFLNPSMHDKVTVRTRLCVLINSNCDNVKNTQFDLDS